MGEAESHFEVRAPPAPYRCFLVRCWMEKDAGVEGTSVWRFSVCRAKPGIPRRAFASLADVMAHIGAELAACEYEQQEK